MPIGSIVAWHRDILQQGAKLLLPPGWIECNGQTIYDPGSILNNQPTPNLNGEQKFLRGGNLSGIPEDATEIFQQPNYPQGITIKNDDGSYSETRGAYQQLDNAQDTRLWYKVRPTNMSVIWIMKVKQIVQSVGNAVTEDPTAPQGSIHVGKSGDVQISGNLDVKGTINPSSLPPVPPAPAPVPVPTPPAAQMHEKRYTTWVWSFQSATWVQASNLILEFKVPTESILIMSANGQVYNQDTSQAMYSSFFVNKERLHTGVEDWGQYFTTASVGYIPMNFTQMAIVKPGACIVQLMVKGGGGKWDVNGAAIQITVIPR